MVGGINSRQEYLSNAEIFAPDQPLCHGALVAEFPHRIMGAVAGVVEGRGVVCGGAVEEYVECTKDAIGELNGSLMNVCSGKSLSVTDFYYSYI